MYLIHIQYIWRNLKDQHISLLPQTNFERFSNNVETTCYMSKKQFKIIVMVCQIQYKNDFVSILTHTVLWHFHKPWYTCNTLVLFVPLLCIFAFRQCKWDREWSGGLYVPLIRKFSEIPSCWNKNRERNNTYKTVETLHRQHVNRPQTPTHWILDVFYTPKINLSICFPFRDTRRQGCCRQTYMSSVV